MCFWYLSRSHMHPSKASKKRVFTMNFNDFTIMRNMIFDDFLFYFVTSFGIAFWWLLVSILAPFWDPFCIKFHVFGCSFFFWWICESICYWSLIDFWSKTVSTSRRGITFVSVPFPHTCTFYWRKTYKCQKPFFNFFKQIKEFIHTCTFYPRITYKCAMIVLPF